MTIMLNKLLDNHFTYNEGQRGGHQGWEDDAEQASQDQWTASWIFKVVLSHSPSLCHSHQDHFDHHTHQLVSATRKWSSWLCRSRSKERPKQDFSCRPSMSWQGRPGMIRIILNLHLMAMMTFNIRDLPPVLLVGGNDVSVLTSLT